MWRRFFHWLCPNLFHLVWSQRLTRCKAHDQPMFVCGEPAPCKYQYGCFGCPEYWVHG